MNDDDLKVVDAMEKYGGSFVKALANCFRHADTVNFQKLKVTFNAYWRDYEAKAKWK